MKPKDLKRLGYTGLRWSTYSKSSPRTRLTVYERLKPKDDESTYLTYTGLIEELEYLKIETRLIDEKFTSVMNECVV